MASGAQAHERDAAAECNGSATGMTIKGDLIVPSGGSCQLHHSTVRRRAMPRFAAADLLRPPTRPSGETSHAKRSQTVFIEKGSNVRGNIGADRVSQVFLFDSTSNGNIGVERAGTTESTCVA